MLIRTRIGVIVLLLAIANPAPADSAFKVSNYQGNVLVVDFWASWCTPCRRSFPWLNRMQDDYADAGLIIVGINVDKEYNDAAKFLADVPADFAIVYDSDGIIAKNFGVPAMPSTYVFDRDGQLSARHFGYKVKKQASYEATIRALLDLQTGGPYDIR